MDKKKIDELVEKLLMSRFTKIDEVKQGDSHQPHGDPDTPIRYQDWLKQQPRPKKKLKG